MISAAQAAMLRNARTGRPLCAGLIGRSAHGGATWTMQALQRKGMMKLDGTITDAGLAALSDYYDPARKARAKNRRK